MSKKHLDSMLCKLVAVLPDQVFQLYLGTLSQEEMQYLFQVCDEAKRQQIETMIENQPIYFEAEEVISMIKSKLK